jgi:hypothetical protein
MRRLQIHVGALTPPAGSCVTCYASPGWEWPYRPLTPILPVELVPQRRTRDRNMRCRPPERGDAQFQEELGQVKETLSLRG